MKAPSYVNHANEAEQRRLTLAGMIAHHAGIFSDVEVSYFLQNDNKSKVPELLATVASLGQSQIIGIKAAAKADSSRIAIPSELAAHWEARWKTVYGVKTDFAGLVIHEPPTTFKARLIVMSDKGSEAPELLYRSNEKLMAKSCKHWKFCGNKSLDEEVPKHAMTGTFGVWVDDSDEASFGNLGGVNLSTIAIRELKRLFGIRTTTLPVRLVHGADVFLENDSEKHLDRTVVTVCSESETARGNVPSVCFFPDCGEVYVSYWLPADACGGARFRPAIC